MSSPNPNPAAAPPPPLALPAPQPHQPPGGPLRWRVALLWGLAGLAAFAASRGLSELPAAADLYGRTLGVWLARLLSIASGVFPLSVAEVLLAAYLVWLATAAVGALAAVRAGRRSAAHALAGGGLRAVRDAGAFAFLLYVLWGFNYAKPPLETQLGWPRWEGAQLEEVVALAEAAVAAANRAYLELHGTPDAGAPTSLAVDPEALEASLDVGWARTAEKLGLAASMGSPRGRVKQPLSSPLLARMGLLGVYSPFTGEAHVVRGMPAVRVPFSMAHEKAHQRGVAIESEASFLGILACSYAPDPLARYAGASFVQAQLVGALPARERRRVAALRLPGVERDLRDLEAYRRRNESVAGTVQSAVNDRYLRANRVPGGIQSYGRSAFLLILYAREHPEELAPGGILSGEPGEAAR